MKIEAEVVYAFEGAGQGGGGCSANGAAPTAQERSSIDRPEWQPPGCGGCGHNTTSAFDCEHFQFIDDDDEDDGPQSQATPGQEDEAPQGDAGPHQLSPMGESESVARAPGLRPVLKRAGGAARKHSNRVTFDEAVTLYSGESEDVQMLALTTGPDIIYTDVFYMFEPPIEYQDVPPFEPPAEYRDADEPPAAEPTPDEPILEPPPAAPASDPEEDRGDVAVSPETGDTDSAADQEPGPGIESTLESDKLFERFLEAEREFAVDEELDSVFQALETDFSADDKNGALDDNFFRKLISLLSSAEGDPTEPRATPEADDYFSDPGLGGGPDDDDSSQAHSRTLSEADSDCSISSQDTIIVRFGEDDGECAPPPPPEDVPAPPEERPRPLPRESLLSKPEKADGESLSRQSSGEQSVASQDPPQDADDSTSSDSRSGEVEEEIRLDDIGYDEEDAEDYDEESFRGMAHGNSKIRRIIKKNALQCSLFRGIEAKRRQQPGAKYPRPKSPLLSQESLVEKLKWLTTIDEQRDVPKPPDVILSAGGVPVNGASSEDDMAAFQQPPYYQQRHGPPQPPAPAYYVRLPPTHHPSLPRQRGAPFQGHGPPVVHTLPYVQGRVLAHPPAPLPVQWPEQLQRPSMTVPRNFRDWRVIQRITGSRGGERAPPVAADYVRCPKDELEQFVEKDSKRMDMIRKRYSVAEEDDDPTFGFARRPSVRGVQNRIQANPSENPHATNELFEEPIAHGRPAYPGESVRVWTREPGWRPDVLYGPGRSSQVPMHIHRASVALTELPGSATLPYTHRKPPPDTRYHSYAESMYGSTRTLPTTKGWLPPDPRAPVSPPMLQVPPHPQDERGVPEGASSSPKISSDSLYPESHKEDGIIYYSLNV